MFALHCPGLPGSSPALAVTVAVAFAAACENPRPPVSCSALASQTVFAGETATLEACFEDPNGDVLVIAAATSDPGIVVADAAGNTVTVAGVSPGTASVTVTATDPGGLHADERFQVEVPNRAPFSVGMMRSLELAVGDSARVDASDYFDDPDGQGLGYAAAASDSGVLAVSLEGSVLTVRARAKGMVSITVTATDPGGLEATQSFAVTVPNRAPETVGSIAARTVEVGKTVAQDLAAYFRDPDGDPLAYAAVSADAKVAAVSVDGDSVAITAPAKGETTVSVTAADAEGLTATQVFTVIVPNRTPIPVGTIPPDTVTIGDRTTVDLSAFFDDPDGDPLVYAVTASDTTVVGVAVSGGAVLSITAIAAGEATVTSTATDTEGLAANQAFAVTVAARPPVEELTYDLVRTLPHDHGAYTQGLLVHDGIFFESTGRYGRSEVRQVEIATGEVLRSRALADNHFGEGLARVGERLIQLTWKAGLAFVRDAATLDSLGTFEYQGEGWGLCHDGESLYMSNGSDTLQRRDPDTFDLLGRIEVTRTDSAVHNLNELECVGDHIYANVYRSSEIVRIDKMTGVVTGVLDAQPLARASGRPANPAAVLNGIAYDRLTGTFYVTGKLWPVMFEIEVAEK
ncbi:MAG: hypothetical protein F4139_07315 [Gemmatimonadetes bacterium]|nr:hypothetical protein [Gemmatimonadota bacterium]MYH52747.1 hypothetical protein [Gemmatimonadota bacterium]MYK66000.1 hypothetical protein [Gemmatimonadota bacterium]